MKILRLPRRHLMVPVFIASIFSCSALAVAQEASPSPEPTPTAPSSPPPEASPPQPVPSPVQSGTFGNQYDGRWHFNLTPFLWVPTINGSLHFTNFSSARSIVGAASQIRSVDFNVGPNKYLAKLNGAAMFGVEARKGDSAILTNFVWVNVSSLRNSIATISGTRGNVSIPITVSSGARIAGTIWELALSQTLAHDSRSSVNALLGFRYHSLTASADWILTGPLGNFSRSNSVSQFTNAFAPIVGFTGRVGLSDHFFIPYYGDYGSTGGLQTFQYYGGLAYAYRSGAIILLWRHLQYESTDPSNLIRLIKLGGPTLAWNFRL